MSERKFVDGVIEAMETPRRRLVSLPTLTLRNGRAVLSTAAVTALFGVLADGEHDLVLSMQVEVEDGVPTGLMVLYQASDHGERGGMRKLPLRVVMRKGNAQAAVARNRLLGITADHEGRHATTYPLTVEGKEDETGTYNVAVLNLAGPYEEKLPRRRGKEEAS